ncbi:MAG: type II toxin-antitoxin system RelE/ParE family toxin [Acinetobacter sp.]|nr:type II toxin-antitoxin system RelE/ParE family toxin [Acinetobacter sp.]
MDIRQTPLFERTVKKLSKQDKADLDEAVKLVANDPDIGERTVGDLLGVSVYKFKMNKQPVLLAYSVDEEDSSVITLYLLKLGSHENFYRDLKQHRD